MDNAKKLILTVTSILKRRLPRPEFVVDTVLVVVLCLFFLQRHYELLIFLLACGFYLLYLKVFTKLPGQLILKVGLAVSVLLLALGLVFSYSYTRMGSWDGQLWYIARVISLHTGFPLNIINTAHPPFLAEMFLSFVLKVSSFRFVSVVLYLSALINIPLIYWLYKCQGYVRYKNILTYTVVFSPIFLSMMLMEFKVEHFLLNASLLAFIFFYRQKTHPTFLNSFLFGLFSAVAVLTKVSVLPFFIVLPAISILMDFISRKRCRMAHTALSASIMVVIILVWVANFGISIPWTGINYFPGGLEPAVVFDKDAETYTRCLRESKEIDFSQFLYSTNKINVFFQPLSYLLDPGFIDFTRGLNFVEPGFVIYFSIILFTPLVLINGVFRRDPVFLVSLAYLIYYYIHVQGIFWYLFFLFPILVVPLADKALPLFEEKNLVKPLYLTLGLMYLFFGLAIVGDLIIKGRQPLEANPDNVRISRLLNTLEGFVFDASPHPNQAFLTFVDDYHRRVIKDPLYFGYTDKSDLNVLDEFKSHNIKYIVVLLKQTLLYNKAEYYGCPKTSALRAVEFARQYGKALYYNSETGVSVYSLW